MPEKLTPRPPRLTQREYVAAEVRRIDDRPLPPARLAAIWRGLPERERFHFLLSLDEQLVADVLILTVERNAPCPT